MKNVAICALFAAGVSAIPMAAAPLHAQHGHLHHHKRDVVWVTEIDVEVVTDVVTRTVWVDAAGSTNEANGGHRHPYPTTTSDSAPVKTTTSTHVVPSSASTPAYVAPTSESTSAYVAPTTTSSAYVAPTTTTTTTPAYVAPTTTTTTTPAYVAPTTTTSVYVAPTTSSATPATTSAPSLGGSSYVGQLSYYDTTGGVTPPGYGSCGQIHYNDEMVVALDVHMMDKATDCGREIVISANGVTATATIVDTCPGCAGTAGLDLSPSLFAKFANTAVGIIPGATWSFN